MTALTLENVLEIENEESLLAFVCRETNIPLWTTVRYPLLLLILQKLFYEEGAFDVDHNKSLGSGGAFARLKLMAMATIHNQKFLLNCRQDYPIVISATGARTRKISGKYFNQLCDYFVGVDSKKIIVLEDLFEGRWPFPRVYDNLLLKAPLRAAGAISGKINSKKYRPDVGILIQRAVARTREILGIEISQEEAEKLVDQASRAAGSLSNRYKTYRSLFNKLHAKVLIKEEALYGGADNAAAVAAAKDLGMVTAEYQHGAISKGHIAYNFAPVIAENLTFRRILPEYFLSYGEWWSNQINAPVQKIDIGNPHRSNAPGGGDAGRGNDKEILILGDGIETSRYIEFCRKLQSQVDGKWTVKFRPHPLERSATHSLLSNENDDWLNVDMNGDIFTSFAQASVVVAEVSTGLFEAIGYAPRIFVWRTEKSRFAIPNHPFKEFQSVSDFVESLQRPDEGRISDRAAELFWSRSWQQKFANFIDGAVAGIH